MELFYKMEIDIYLTNQMIRTSQENNSRVNKNTKLENEVKCIAFLLLTLNTGISITQEP